MRAKTDFGLDTMVRLLYLEPLVRDKNVLVLGPHAEGGGEVLRRMGAGRVSSHALGGGRPLPWDLAGLRGKRDADPGRSLPVRKGEADLVFVPDLGEIDDYRAVLGETSRILGESGLLVLSVRNAECTVPVSETGLEEVPEVWSLDSLSEMLGQYFEHVEIIGQSPFLGYALASYEVERGRQGVRLDTSLMGEEGEDPEFIVALCAHRRPARPLTNALFQMPMAEMALVEGRAPERRPDESPLASSLRAEVESLKRELGNRNVVVSRLEREIERLEGEAEAARQKMFDVRQQMEKDRKEQQADALESAMRKEIARVPETWLSERAALTRELEDATRARAKAEADLADLQARLDRSEERLREAGGRLERSEAKGRELRVKLKQAESRMREDETRIPEMGRRTQELERSLDDAEKALAGSREERAALEARLADAGAMRDRLATELEAVREECVMLAARTAPASSREAPASTPEGDGPTVVELRREIDRREELIRDLIRELEVLPAILAEEGPPGEDRVHDLVGEMEKIRGEREDLARRVASLVAELEQARARAADAERETTEAAALVEMVGDALEQGRGAASAKPGKGGDLNRTLRDIQEALRRIAGDPRGSTVARELGMLWAEIEERRKGL